MVLIEARVCDICRDAALPVKIYEVRCEDRVATTDRCVNHSILLEEILTAGQGDGPQTPRRGRRSGPQVVTIDEIEQTKKRQR